MSKLFGAMGRYRFVLPEFNISIYKDEKKEWRWQVKSKNGKIIGSSSEGFDSKRNCLNNLKLLGDMINSFYASEQGKPE